MTSIAVPPDKLRANLSALCGYQTDYTVNHNGAIIHVETNVPQYADVKLWYKALGMNLSQFSDFLGKPKKTVIRWLKGAPDSFADLSRETVLKIRNAIIKDQTGIPTVPEYRDGTISSVLIL